MGVDMVSPFDLFKVGAINFYLAMVLALGLAYALAYTSMYKQESL